MQKDRDLSFDVFRGVAIIAVVAIHTMTVFKWGHSKIGVWNPLSVVTYYRQSLNFAVPVFVFISGYWASTKPIESLVDYRIFLTRKLSRVLIPYFFWSFILLGYETVRAHSIDWQQITFKLLTGRATHIYYFIAVISQLYIITPLLQYLNRKRYGVILVLIFTMINLLFAYLLRLYFNYWIPFSSAFYSWVIFYEIGLLAHSFENKVFITEKIRYFILPVALACLLLSGLETSIISSKYYDRFFAIAPLKLSSILYSICIIIAFLHIKRHLIYRPKFLAALGYYSFGIYLIHMAVLNPVADIVQKSSTIYSFQPLCHLLVVLITISICFVLIDVARKLFPKSFCHNVLGF
jgi:surface polysaccharide O-acyltransferase-like enzyme